MDPWREGQTVTLAGFFYFWMAGAAAEALVLFLLIRRCAFATLPVFTSYMAWSLLSDLGQYAASNYYPKDAFRLYVISLAIDSLFLFVVLIELSRSDPAAHGKVLCHDGPPSLLGFSLLSYARAIWPLANSPEFSKFTPLSRIFVHLQQTVSILRILFFLTLAGCSQLFSIGWRDCELQIATGLGFFFPWSVFLWQCCIRTWSGVRNTISSIRLSPPAISAHCSIGPIALPSRKPSAANSPRRCKTSFSPWPEQLGRPASPWRIPQPSETVIAVSNQPLRIVTQSIGARSLLTPSTAAV